MISFAKNCIFSRFHVFHGFPQVVLMMFLAFIWFSLSSQNSKTQYLQFPAFEEELQGGLLELLSFCPGQFSVDLSDELSDNNRKQLPFQNKFENILH